ncbi:hypothetical protein CQ12_05575 [Bradyrhizobium jicamae]|uniref:Uncharacterized protein n=1 Tax=Bradyrhizobium jicamae TaxID=280332 RepID=A0A0R3LTH3_9BRAD|nr:hypothetical protein [Bradyrhizobium jicamae]KRR11297.1 hypothetical protein CQ12_05575 [Bradyrhizobium jicamae]
MKERFPAAGLALAAPVVAGCTRQLALSYIGGQFMSVRPFADYVHDWETPALAAEVHRILASIGAPPIDDHGLFTFQKILYRRYFDYDARGQIILTCRCILESEGNEGAFAEPFVGAVYGVCSKQSFADRGLDLVAAFDQIPLQDIVKTMRGLDLFKESSIRHYLSMIVENKVRKILFPPQPEPPPKPSRRERIAADKRAAAAARNRNVERKMDLGRKLATLRDVMPNNRRFGAAVRKQFDLHDPLEVAEMARVARRYGDRPEIFRKVGWRVLVELASSATSEAKCREFEARIAAGECVNGAEVIRARTPIGVRRRGRFNLRAKIC